MTDYDPKTGYHDDYRPGVDPVVGSAHCETLTNRLVEELGGTAGSYTPSEDGKTVTFTVTLP